MPMQSAPHGPGCHFYFARQVTFLSCADTGTSAWCCRNHDRDGEPIRDIARSYNVHNSTISRLTGDA
jgi:hypothetical protein